MYTGEKMKKYREWLPANGYEATGSLGGSFVSNNIEDYYVTPYEMGYGSFVKFDHDFIGREALEKKSKEPNRKKVTFVWNGEDVTEDCCVAVHARRRALQVHRPAAVQLRVIVVRQGDEGRKGRRSLDVQRYQLQRAVDAVAGDRGPDVKVGDELTLVWGEEDGGTKKSTVERHKQTEIRVTVGAVPYGQMARETYRPK